MPNIRDLMLNHLSPGFFRHAPALGLGLACLLALFCSCGPQEPPLSPAAQKFKGAALTQLKAVSEALGQPLAEGKAEAMNRVLAASLRTAEREGAPVPATMGVLDGQGFVLARYPAADGSGEHFADYQVFKEVTRTRRIGKQTLYLADGSRQYVIAAPLLSQEKLAGLLVLVFRAGEVQDQWQVSGQEFMALDFNK